MPSRTLLLCAALGLLIVGGMIASGLFATRGTRLALKGSTQKTRVAAVGAARTAVVVDFRITNTSDYPFVLKSMDMELTTADDRKVMGRFVPEVDTPQLFAGAPTLGEKYNKTAAIRQKIGPQETLDLMLASIFDLKEADVAARKDLVIRLTDVDGPQSEIR